MKHVCMHRALRQVQLEGHDQQTCGCRPKQPGKLSPQTNLRGCSPKRTPPGTRQCSSTNSELNRHRCRPASKKPHDSTAKEAEIYGGDTLRRA